MAMYDHIHHLDNVGKQLEKKVCRAAVASAVFDS